MMETIIFYILATMVVVPAVLVVTVKNVFHSALWLVFSLISVAGVYAMLAADFLFAVQLLVYAGGIMVVMLFVVLLSGKPSDWNVPQLNEKSWGAALFSVFFVAVIGTTLHHWVFQIVESQPEVTTAKLGQLLLTKMVLPLEVVALVMLVSLLGAIFFSSKKVS